MKQKTEYKNRIQDRETEIERLRNQVRIVKCEKFKFVCLRHMKKNSVFEHNFFAVNYKELQHNKSDRVRKPVARTDRKLDTKTNHVGSFKY